ncbi:glutathione S-transferase 1-1-like [Periplaneta americana]|uniref:glutathione S-transferase 1-1-like n=1 Tax=Periplaneta americana TaxID=6978 RepID=UPI0037E8B61B
MTIDFYYTEGSSPCNSVRLLAKALNLDLNMKTLDLRKQEHLTPAYLKINPLHTVPAINDDGFTLAESRVILIYLVEKYGKDDSLYPKYPQKKAIVNQRLYFDISTLYSNFSSYCGPMFFTGKFGAESHLIKMQEALQVLDKYLDGQNWVAGDSLTIADIALTASVTAIQALGFDVSKYPNVMKWCENMKKLAGYDEIIVKGNEIIKNIFNSMK